MLLRLEEPRCFTDSQVALFWIKGVEKEWKPFVQHRVEEIPKLTSVHCWSHCAGKNNPADIPDIFGTVHEQPVERGPCVAEGSCS